MKNTRVAVTGPGEAPAQVYPKGREPKNLTVLRQAERKWRKWKKKSTGDEQPVELEAGQHKALPGGAVGVGAALTAGTQLQLLASCLQWSGLSSLSSHYCDFDHTVLWHHLLTRADTPYCLTRSPGPHDSPATQALPLHLHFPHFDAQAALLRRLRWISIGQQYNWADRSYFPQRSPMPTLLSDLSRKICADLGVCQDFRAEAGIVNFYQPGDSLTSHVDRSEKRMDVPLVSFSLGAPCIFLLGGETREDPVTPILLRSGDVLLLNGPSRLFYHGVPQILEPDRTFSPTTREEEVALKVIGAGRVNLNVRQVE